MPEASCQVCRNIFYVKPSHKERGWGKYCSISCKTNSQFLGKILSCSICGKKFYRSPARMKHSKSGKFFCSKSCQTKWRNSFFVEENHPNWSGGKNSNRRILLRSKKPVECTACGLTEKRVLVAHHLDHDRKNNSVSNLIWVCLNCHHLIHHVVEFEKELVRRLKIK